MHAHPSPRQPISQIEINYTWWQHGNLTRQWETNSVSIRKRISRTASCAWPLCRLSLLIARPLLWLGMSFVSMATARCARRGCVDRHLSCAPLDFLPRCTREKSGTREPRCLCRLVDGIEQACIERQIGPYRAARVQE